VSLICVSTLPLSLPSNIILLKCQYEVGPAVEDSTRAGCS
jgi:hypothetical protein